MRDGRLQFEAAEETLLTEIAHHPAGLHPLGSMADLDDFETKVEWVPCLVVVLGTVLAFTVSAVSFTLGRAGVGVAAASAGMLVFSAGLAWLAEERRRVRQAEREFLAGNLAEKR